MVGVTTKVVLTMQTQVKYCELFREEIPTLIQEFHVDRDEGKHNIGSEQY